MAARNEPPLLAVHDILLYASQIINKVKEENEKKSKDEQNQQVLTDFIKECKWTTTNNKAYVNHNE